MHCDKNSLLTKIIKNIPFVNEEYISTCDYHIEHHIEVNPDMTLNENKRKDSLFMGWNTYIFIFFITLLSVFISKNISMYIISYKNIYSDKLSFNTNKLFSICLKISFISFKNFSPKLLLFIN